MSRAVSTDAKPTYPDDNEPREPGPCIICDTETTEGFYHVLLCRRCRESIVKRESFRVGSEQKASELMPEPAPPPDGAAL